MSKIIGGIIPSKNIKEKVCKSVIKMANARSCFWLIKNNLKPRSVWLPDFYCSSLLHVFPKAKFYEVDNDLKIKKLPKTSSEDLFVYIDYFGFPTEIDFEKINCPIVQDASQAFFLPGNPLADFTIKNPRKFFPISDGAILSSKNEIEVNLEEYPWKSEKLWRDAMEYRKIHENDNKTWHKMTKIAKKNVSIGPYMMSCRSERIISRIDWIEETEKRRQGFKKLLSQYKDIALFKELPKKIVPFAFPVLIKNRSKKQKELFNKNIFLPIHWKCGHSLSKNIISIPVDASIPIF